MGLQVSFQVLARYFLFPLDQHADVHREAAVFPKVGFQGLHVDPHLSLVVRRSAGIQVVAPNHGIEGITLPQLNGFRRLDVVMAVQEHGGLAGCIQPVRRHDGMTGRRVHRYVAHADPLQFAGDEPGASVQVLAVVGMGAHAGNAEELLQAFQGLGSLGIEIGYDVVHGPRFRSSVNERMNQAFRRPVTRPDRP